MSHLYNRIAQVRSVRGGLMLRMVGVGVGLCAMRHGY